MPKDEQYILDLCDEILSDKCLRQHRFDFLRGDPGKRLTGTPLPVDGYYEKLRLVIEYRESQHSQPNAHFDKPSVMTVSGVNRRLQRQIYDKRRRVKIPENKMHLIELEYSDFDHSSSGRLKQNSEADLQVLRKRLNKFLKARDTKR